jgi:catechol O-methyltransferase
VRSSVEEKTKKAQQSGASNTEGIAETNVKMYEKRYGAAKFNQSPGKPSLVYESKLVNSYEPTGVPVSLNWSHWLHTQTLTWTGWH